MELKIPQLTLAKIDQLHVGRHETLNRRSEHYSPRLLANSDCMRMGPVQGQGMGKRDQWILIY